MEATEALEQYLRHAPILGIAGPVVGGGGHPGKQRLLLVGGVQVIAKPAVDPLPDTERMLRSEAAAWEIAKALECTGLLATTVVREVPHPEDPDRDVEASVQIVWPDGNQFCAPLESFPEEDIWKAAVFDAVVSHGDRNHNNWLAVPAPGGAELPGLKLIDNGHAFDFPNATGIPQSTFYSGRQGLELPDHVVSGLEALIDKWPIESLDAMVEDEVARERVCERAQTLLQTGVLQI